jgi:predicted DNA-binding antitoxin AbrB/MazE fold protein
MHAIKALYDGTNFKPKEPIPVNEEYEVVITFTTPVKDSKKQSGYFSNTEKDALRKSLFGVLPSNIDLDEAREERLR